MKISFENPDKISGLMTLTVEATDYEENVEKTLKDYRKKANVPGFRPGQVPMGMIKRQFGASVKMDSINKILGEKIYKYLEENNINMLGEPLPNEDQKPVDLEGEPPYTFVFDIAVSPEIKAELSANDTIDFYNLKVDDDTIDKQIDAFASRSGNYEKADEYQDNDMLKGDLRELDENGNTKEDGITVEEAVMMPSYIKVEDEKKLFDGVKLGDVITFNPKKAYPDNDSEIASLLKLERDQVKDLTADFSYQVTEIKRFKKHEVNQELFDQVYGKDNIKSEEDFRKTVARDLQRQFAVESDYRFLVDVRRYMENKVGEVTYPEALMKRIMLANNKDKGQEFVDKNYDTSIKELTWHIIKNQLANANEIKIDDNDVKESAKMSAREQFAQYGMSNVPDEYLDNYVTEMLKKKENIDGFVDRAIDKKLISALKKVVKLNEKEISLADFSKL
jgi:trigger factor